MHFLPTFAALLCVAASPFVHAEGVLVEPKEVRATRIHTGIAATSLGDKRNYLNEATQPICLNDVTRVREASFNGTLDLYIEVTGCALPTPRWTGLCDPHDTCRELPFELHIVGPESTPGFNPVDAMLKGRPVDSPYKIRSIMLL